MRGALVKAANSAVPTAFVPVQLPPAQAAPADIRIELRRGPTAINVSWPCTAAFAVRGVDARAAAVIRIEAVWLAVEPIDMRAGVDRLLASVVQVFGAAQAHHGYLFANARSSRIRLSCTTASGCGRRTTAEQGQLRVATQHRDHAAPQALTKDQFDALVLGLPWQRLEQMRVITRM